MSASNALDSLDSLAMVELMISNLAKRLSKNEYTESETRAMGTRLSHLSGLLEECRSANSGVEAQALSPPPRRVNPFGKAGNGVLSDEDKRRLMEKNSPKKKRASLFPAKSVGNPKNSPVVHPSSPSPAPAPAAPVPAPAGGMSRMSGSFAKIAPQQNVINEDEEMRFETDGSPKPPTARLSMTSPTILLQRDLEVPDSFANLSKSNGMTPTNTPTKNGQNFNRKRMTMQERKIFTEKMAEGGFETKQITDSGSFDDADEERVSEGASLTPNAAAPLDRRFSVGSLLMAKARAREAFQMLDRNGDGFLRKEDVFEALTLLHFDERFNMAHASGDMDAAMKVVDDMIEEIDKDGDGKIDLDEFVDILTTQKEDSDGGMQQRMSLLARNIVQAHQKKEEGAILGTSYLINPNNEKNVYFDLIIALLIILTVLTLPLCLAWEEINDGMSRFNLFVDFLFLFDVAKNFNTGFIDMNDNVIMDRQIVVRTYTKGWFLIDLVSSVPIELLIGDDKSNLASANSGVKTLKLLRVAKVLRLFKLSKTFKWMKEGMKAIEERLQWRMSDAAIKLTKLSFFVLFAAHWIACFHWFLCRSFNFPEDSWVVFSELEGDDISVSLQYSWSLFKALAQMITIGFETPPFTNVSCTTTSEWCSIETWTTLLCLYIGTIFYALLISNTSTIIMQLNQAKRQFEEKIQQVNEYMRDKKLPSGLRDKVRDYYHLAYSEGKIFDETGILSELAPSLRSEILRYNSRELYSLVPVFSSSPFTFTAEVANAIKPEIAFAEENVMVEDTSGSVIYFIYKGIAEVRPKNHKESVFTAIGDGCYFGDVALFFDCKRTATVKTKTLCIMYTIAKEDLLYCLTDFPEIMEYMKIIATHRKKRIDIINDGEDVFEFVDDEDSKTELFTSTVEDHDDAGHHHGSPGSQSSPVDSLARGRRNSKMALDTSQLEEIVKRQQQQERRVSNFAGNRTDAAAPRYNSASSRRRASDLHTKIPRERTRQKSLRSRHGGEGGPLGSTSPKLLGGVSSTRLTAHAATLKYKV